MSLWCRFKQKKWIIFCFHTDASIRRRSQQLPKGSKGSKPQSPFAHTAFKNSLIHPPAQFTSKTFHKYSYVLRKILTVQFGPECLTFSHTLNTNDRLQEENDLKRFGLSEFEVILSRFELSLTSGIRFLPHFRSYHCCLMCIVLFLYFKGALCNFNWKKPLIFAHICPFSASESVGAAWTFALSLWPVWWSRINCF